MKINTLTFLFIFCAVSIWSQNNKLSIGISGKLEFSNYEFKKTPPNTSDIYNPFEGYSNANNVYNPLIGYSIGLNFFYDLSEKISVGTGIAYASEGYELLYNYNSLTNVIPPTKSELKVYYLRVPIKVGTTLFKLGKLDLKPSLSTIFDFQIDKKENIYYQDGLNGESKYLGNDINQTLLSLCLDFGFEYNAKENLSMVFAPFISKRLTTLDENRMKSTKLSYGVIFSINYKI
ncbi:outer membrane protein with beta-barrel domain [Mariniflexile fucanivorans]|uniref:Outer membrane protein with beta-barrel domain n=1 Tax=Mariniflexile fucanivorans TaxID=264023 RepID=A0A4R1RDL9_9FLAO|nr:outer membrane beta-barrel protein [Mariniflexile fucanivorans]TCL63965.1 outer membrane protein with beta-barrel domain [Mariniflexile fucanivorans]